MRPTRRHMDPSTLEMVLMLRMNKHAWSRETLQEILDDKKKEARERSEGKRKAEKEVQEEQDDVDA